MNNELGYIDKEPFKKIDKNKQDMIILNSKEDSLEIKVNGIEKYDSFEMFTSGPGKLIKSNLYYGITSKYYPITFFDASIRNTTYRSISSTTIISKIYAIGRESIESIKHVTPKTKIKKFDYYNDKLIFYFTSNPISIKRKGIKEEITLNAKTVKPKKIFSLKYNDGNEIFVYLIHSFSPNGNTYDFSIKANTYLQIRFKKSVSIDDVLRISARIDATLHMCILNKNRSYIVTVYDYSKRSYNLYNDRQKNIYQKKNPTFNICKNRKDVNVIFKNLLSLFINIDFEKQIAKRKEKDDCFLKKYLKKYLKVKEYFFYDEDINTLESEIRSLRNYYSHKGFYVEQLPIPTYKPKRYKKIDIQWVYDVKRLVKIIAYNEIYDKANITIDGLELINYLY